MKIISVLVFSVVVLSTSLPSCSKKNFDEINSSDSNTQNLKGSPSDSVWEAFIGNNQVVRALPDFYSNYYAFSFDRTQGSNKYIGIRLKGQFGYSRYMSYNLYDAKKGTTFGGFTDTALVPDEGSTNPFKDNADFYAAKRNYTLTVIPQGYSTNDSNVFIYNSDSINVISVMIRYYVPQQSETAGVPLPEVETFDVRTGDAVPVPKTFSIQNDGPPLFIYTLRLKPIWQTAIDDTLRFYHAAGSGQFNNADNIYLISALKRIRNEVFVLRFKPPTFRHDTTTEANTDVRYWSINEGRYNTTTPFGLKDADFKPAADGYIYVAIGDNDTLFKRKASAGGYNFMEWSVRGPLMVLLYRNMLGDPSFPGYLGKVPDLDLSNLQNIYTQNAHYFIGDYAPQGQRMTRLAFLRNYGGWPSPGF